MNFRSFIETEEQEREQLKARMLKAIEYVYGRPTSFQDANIDENIFRLWPVESIKKVVEDYESKKEYKKKERGRFEKMIQQAGIETEEDRKKIDQSWQEALHTKKDDYYRTGNAERAVCADNDPQFDKKGMPAYNNEITDIDPELKGYYAVHVGDAEEWLPILKRDGYCDHKNAYIYEILCEESQEPFYDMEDYHVMDKTENPNSYIIFSKYQTIPANLIRLVKVVPMSKVRTARIF